ncbi:MAG TPA: NAD(P)H-hydrate dehydratase [Candidatus Omnitrophica bacterium]|nr:MAG: NAD(P)H-hydrate dehydratase [Omnitrophica WOR_2 bacterium GWA2_45_18]HBR15512.1 NAD(P)H-hydrate dehydratase [Candidatus Omnitrophota bacterium]
MRLPTPLSRRDIHAHKNDFGHVFILAGSRRMLGAAALSGLAAMRSGAGLVTVGIPQSLNAVLQKKLSPVVMTLPLNETKDQSLSLSAFHRIEKLYDVCTVLALGPGLSAHPETRKLVLKIVATSPLPLVIDADALNALACDLDVLTKSGTVKILTPHPGEMARLTQLTKTHIENNRSQTASEFAKKYHCTVLLKGHRTVVASSRGDLYINKTGNPGMATAGSGDVLTGMIAAFLAQGLSGFEAAKYGAYIHGRAGDLAAGSKTRLCMIASDIIDHIPLAVKGREGSQSKKLSILKKNNEIDTP